VTDSNYRSRQQQPRGDLEQSGNAGPGQDVNQQSKAIARRKAMISKVAEVVRDSARDMERLLPDHIPVATFMAAAGASLWKSEDLMAGAINSPDSFLVALRESAMLGHIPGTPHYWLTPRRAGKVWTVLGIEGYEGIIERMYRSGGVLSVHADVAYSHDEFELEAGPGGRPVHRRAGKLGAFSSRADRGQIIGAYAYAILQGGIASQAVVMNMEDIAERRAVASARAIWDKWPIPMMKKTALRALEPYVPVSAFYRSTAVQAQSFVATVAPQAPIRMEDAAGPEDGDNAGEPVEGEVVGGPEGGGRPVTDVPFEPEQWGGDPAWEGLSVTRPGDGVPPQVRGDR
jgi:recombination protein RecT